MEVWECMDCEVCVGDGLEVGGGEVIGVVVGLDGDGVLDGVLEGLGVCVLIGSVFGVFCVGVGGVVLVFWLVVGIRLLKRFLFLELLSLLLLMVIYEVGISNSVFNIRDSFFYLF